MKNTIGYQCDHNIFLLSV